MLEHTTELQTLQDELVFTKNKLHNCEEEAEPVILMHIRQIERDIRRVIAIIKCNPAKKQG